LPKFSGIESRPVDPDPGVTEVSGDTSEILNPEKDLTELSQDILSDEMALPKPTKLVRFYTLLDLSMI
jgi:hypothetical protein